MDRLKRYLVANFEHLFVLFSIILGLGLTELLSSLHNLLHPSTRVRWHWLSLVWAWIVFQSIVFWWWAMFGYTALEVPNFFELLLLLMAPVIMPTRRSFSPTGSAPMS